MKHQRCYLDDYPLAQHYAVCEDYLYNKLNRKTLSERIAAEGVIYFDISDVMDLFPRLTLDEEYRLICYLSCEYHGIWGRIAAVKNGDSREPVRDPGKAWLERLTRGRHFELPEGAAPPMEAIYNDGSPHGYFEALLAEEFLGAIPYANFEQERWDECILCYPERFCSDWDIYEMLSDLRPHFTRTRNGSVIVSVFWQHFENGFGSSNGCDEIRLAQHTFSENLNFWHDWDNLWNGHTMYKAQIRDDSRYRKGRCCSVSREQAITVAVQKDWRTLAAEEAHE